jgi:hypothetical protein
MPWFGMMAPTIMVVIARWWHLTGDEAMPRPQPGSILMTLASCAVSSVAVVSLISGGANAASADADEMIRDALSAVPPSIANTATVMDWDHRVLRQGVGTYVCFPTPLPVRSRGREPMCLDNVWLAWLDAWMNAKPFTADRVGIAYMLAGDTGASAIDPYASKATAENEWVIDGPHIMLVVPNAAQLEGLPTNPKDKGPYVMWKGTPYAHIMVPLAEPTTSK